jgi:hypothetical protein
MTNQNANLLQLLVENLADRVHAKGDALLHAQGLTVERLPWGRRRISDPRLPAMLDRRRLRLMRDGLDPIDRALMDPATAELFAATALPRGGGAEAERDASTLMIITEARPQRATTRKGSTTRTQPTTNDSTTASAEQDQQPRNQPPIKAQDRPQNSTPLHLHHTVILSARYAALGMDVRRCSRSAFRPEPVATTRRSPGGRQAPTTPTRPRSVNRRASGGAPAPKRSA